MRFIFNSRDRITIRDRDFRPFDSSWLNLRLASITEPGECLNYHPHRLHIEGRQDGARQSKPPSSA